MRRNRWSIQEQIQFLEKVGLLLGKGYTLSNAIEMIQLQKSSRHKVQLQQSLNKLKLGHSLHDVLVEYEFSNEVLSYLFFAQLHGDLCFALLHGGRLLKKKNEYKQKIEKLLRYPIFLLFIVFLLVLFIYQVLLPQFIQLYSSMDIELNPFMVAFIKSLEWFPYLLYLVSANILMMYLAYFFYFKKQSATKKMDLFLKIPFVNKIIKLKNTQYFCLQLSSLLKGGLSILESLTVFDQQDHLPFFKENANKIKRILTEGERFEKAVDGSHYYEKDFSAVVLHGQASGNLPQELEDYSEMLFERIEELLNKLMAYVQPIIFLSVGLLVITLYLSIMVPLLQMVNGI